MNEDEQTFDKAEGDGGDAPVNEDYLAWLKGELTRLAGDAEGGMWARRKFNDDVRFCQWDGQSEDGRKHQVANAGRKLSA